MRDVRTYVLGIRAHSWKAASYSWDDGAADGRIALLSLDRLTFEAEGRPGFIKITVETWRAS